ncbi:hypothetical protein Patl1_27615 [Pistacia atlantica]|uniref:Uncharacterized protein n=1 Tax=Pistacia atlantica TaxID=434234 RepID=A0ACC1BG79_9ROSI|nr:hypothetical protein Patl1_27615 [Pistacia atlantica]
MSTKSDKQCLQVQAENGGNTIYAATAAPVHQKEEDSAAKDKANASWGQNPGVDQEIKNKISNGQPEKSNGRLGYGNKPEVLGSFDHYDIKPVNSLKPNHLLPNNQESSYTSPAEISNESSRIGEKKLDSNLQKAFGSSDLDANMKPVGKPDHLLQNKQANG